MPAMKQQNGFTLIELLLASAIGLIVLGAVGSTFVSGMITNSDNLKMARLNQELRATMLMMTRDIRRAGAWGGAAVGAGGNPFDGMILADQVLINGSNVALAGTDGVNDCIEFSYDLDGDGVVDPVAPDTHSELYGFRLDFENTGGIQKRFIEIRQGGTNCAGAGWESVTDKETIFIDELEFAINPTTKTLTGTAGPLGNDAQMIIREITVTLAGHLVDDISVRKRVTETIRVRNDQFIPAS